MKEGYEVSVQTLAYPDKIFKGTINKISEVLDPSNKTLRVRIKLENEDLLLKPEMFTKVIVTDRENLKAICIPTKALISQNGKNFVVIYKSNNDMEISDVNILKTVGDKTYTTVGISPGQKLITKNQILVFQQLLNN